MDESAKRTYEGLNDTFATFIRQTFNRRQPWASWLHLFLDTGFSAVYR